MAGEVGKRKGKHSERKSTCRLSWWINVDERRNNGKFMIQNVVISARLCVCVFTFVVVVGIVN